VKLDMRRLLPRGYITFVDKSNTGGGRSSAPSGDFYRYSNLLPGFGGKILHHQS